jgi:hypothetical protein
MPSGRLTQNGLFAQALIKYKNEGIQPELIKVYEKVLPGVWSLKGYFDLLDYKIVHDGKRNVFRYILRLSDRIGTTTLNAEVASNEHTRLIPSEIKKEVWKRDKGRCVICGESTKGQASRFSQIYEQYKKAPDVTRLRMYLETMERVLSGTDKTIIDTGASHQFCTADNDVRKKWISRGLSFAMGAIGRTSR